VMRTEVGGTGGAASVAVMAAREEVGWTGGAGTGAGVMVADEVVAVI